MHFKSVIQNAIVWSIAFALQATVKAKQGNEKQKKKVMVKKERKTHREELEGSIRVHVPEVLLEGAGTLIMSPPASMTVKAPECERWRLKPAHAAPLLDTSLSSAACGFETSPRFAGHHELHPGKSIGLEAETQDTVTNHRETISTS